MKVGKLEIDFKPEFGNQQHIKILGMIGDIENNLKILNEKEKASKGARTLRIRIKSQYVSLEEYLKFINKK